MEQVQLNWIANFIWGIADDVLRDLYVRSKQVSVHLYGQEINAETYAIATADFLLKGEGEAADNLGGGPEFSTLANDAFPAREFDFMLSNPPYGKSWKSDLERMGGKSGLKDPRFLIEHGGEPEYSLITRSSDGQMLFLANMLSKIKRDTRLGSRIAEVHNGSSRFTGDAGQGESIIRRWIIENDQVYAAKEIKALKEQHRRAEDAPQLIRKIHKKGTVPDPLHGLFETTIGGKSVVAEYEPDPELRDTEQVPLLEEGDIEAFLTREVLPHAPDAWYVPGSVKPGYEISFTRYFYKPQPLRSLEEIRADIVTLENETEGLLDEIIGGKP